MHSLSKLLEAIENGDPARVAAILDENRELATQRNESGATPLHYAALNGQRAIVRLLVDRGAKVNCPDDEFGATPTGWAIEYLRELGGYLGIELEDLGFAIEQGDVRWVSRYLHRFPSLRFATDFSGKPFHQLAKESGNPEIAKLFEKENRE